MKNGPAPPVPPPSAVPPPLFCPPVTVPAAPDAAPLPPSPATLPGAPATLVSPPLPPAHVALDSMRAQKLFRHSEPLGQSCRHGSVQSVSDRSGEKHALSNSNAAPTAAAACAPRPKTRCSPNMGLACCGCGGAPEGPITTAFRIINVETARSN